jgi:hypothetical protein
MDFVVAHPRSGTTLLAELFNAGGERIAEHEYLAKLSTMGVSLPTMFYEGRAERAAVASLLDHYQYSPTPGVRIDSNWKLTWILGPLLERYPQARVLHLVRDPAETVRSGYNLDYYGALRHTEEFAGDHQRNYWLGWMPRIARADWESLSPFARNCTFWVESQRLLREGLASHPRVLRARLEDLVADRLLLAQVFDFFEVPLPPAERLLPLLAQKVNDRREIKARVAAHRHDVLPARDAWPAEIERQYTSICGAEAAALGYPP